MLGVRHRLLVSTYRPLSRSIQTDSQRLNQVKITLLDEFVPKSTAESTNDKTNDLQIFNTSKLASVQIPYNLPLYIRPNSLISLLSNIQENNFHIKTIYKNVFFNLFHYKSFNSSKFDKILFTSSNKDTSVNNNSIVVSSLGNNKNSSLFHLKIDGTKDWNLFVNNKFNGNPLLAFEDNSSLNIDKNRITGRGNVILNINGSCYNIDLIDQKDQIIINKNCLVAMNGISQFDIKNSLKNLNLNYSINNQLNSNKIITDTEGKQNDKQIVEDFNWKLFMTYNYKILNYLNDHFKKFIFKYFINRNKQFVTINGPRTILLQTNSNQNQIISDFIFSSKLFKKLENYSTSSSSSSFSNDPVKLVKDTINANNNLLKQQSQTNSSTYLHYATITKNKNVVFQSTQDFKDAIR
ncbi:hypothetical protein TBLA_0I00870 [Henningerozyma blattae CBS 6284]|uniref:Altered inheritance of mitochondria protein 24, mitochondrial n=1 Tax=Henningerozyma blattae (strain ATCC 34711 / CBS 6284 / DSM 70876 / NBRC 10599 / NRRL Y-10934 / UCD 77-7) TaxID=1071380 RepID=I2H8P4_HENB6|nr:hypothetical protein TBLA_0I00870 [Tetrapisispora blattae CBS 6284]CCH62746.1 hypothetical protein TBLA_0I00870 [Tetrapisispora blattae CBS 6284]